MNEKLIWTLLLALFPCSWAFAQSEGHYFLSGIVYDSKTRKPEKGAYVAVYEVREGTPKRYEVPSASHALFTASDGRFMFDIDGSRAYIIKVAKEGFDPETVEVGKKEGVGGKRVSIEVSLKHGSGGVLLSEKFVDKNTGAPLPDVKVLIKHLASKTTTICHTDDKGHYYFVISEAGQYELSAQRKDYFAYEADTMNMVWGHFEKFNRALPLTAMGVGVKVRMGDFEYGVKESDLTVKGMVELDKLYKMLVKYPKIHIEIGAHTDARGDAQYNQQISQERATVAAKYLIAKGLQPERIAAIGYGESQLLNHCADGVRCSAQQHAENRRMEYSITQIAD